MLDESQRGAFQGLSTALVVDARVGLGLPESHLDPGIRPLLPFTRMVGTAVTVRFEASAEPAPSDMALYLKASQSPAPGSIIVVEVPPEFHSYGIFGRGTTTRALRSGIVGALIEGAVRDSDDLRAMGFPVFSRTVAPGYTAGKVRAVALGEKVHVGGRPVHSGDIVVGDNDGVVVVRPEELDAVIARAAEIHQWEERHHALIAEGAPYDEVERRSGPKP